MNEHDNLIAACKAARAEIVDLIPRVPEPHSANLMRMADDMKAAIEDAAAKSTSGATVPAAPDAVVLVNGVAVDGVTSPVEAPPT